MLVLVGFAIFAYWWTHPTRFSGVGGAEGYTRPVRIGHGSLSEGVLVFDGMGGGAALRIRGASAHFAPNSAQAQVTFRICTGQPIGLVLDAASYCTKLEGLPATVSLRAGSRQSLIMTISPTSAGQVTVDAISVSYRQDSSELWQRGSQSIPLSLTFPARQ